MESVPVKTSEILTTRIRDILTDAAARLAAVSDTPRLDVEVLLGHILAQPRSYLFANPEELLSSGKANAFDLILQQRLAGQPVAYLIGEREFWSLTLRVNPSTLIPRPETELLVEKALSHVPNDRAVHVLELGTGSGAVALALSVERPTCSIVATDACSDALSIARQNAASHGTSNIKFVAGDWFDPLADRRFDVIVSNPPYVRDADPHLGRGDARFEPRCALAGGPDGLDALRLIISGAGLHLNSDSWLLLEHGYHQADDVAALLSSRGFDSVCCHRDITGHPRVTEARFKAEG